MEDSIAFRPLNRSDFSMLQRWLSEPHVQQWWHEPLDLAGVAAKYERRVDGKEPTHVFIIEYREKPLGLIQWYRWAHYPEHARKLGAPLDSAGIDLAIGEKEMIGVGLGSVAIRKFLDQIVFADPAIRAVISDPEQLNVRSLRAFEKAGFEVISEVTLDGESSPRSVVRLERASR